MLVVSYPLSCSVFKETTAGTAQDEKEQIIATYKIKFDGEPFLLGK